MRDKLATGLSLLALISVAFLHLRVSQIQVANTHQIEGEIRSSDFDLNVPDTKELKNRNVRNSPAVIHNHNEIGNEESETSPTVRMEMKASKSTKYSSAGRTMETNKALVESTQPLPKQFIPLSKQTVENVETFVFFIGYPRSGHSIIASLMDAHPNIVIAHQYNVFGEWVKGNMSKNLRLQDKEFLFNELYKDSWYQATSGWRTVKNNVKGYRFTMAGNIQAIASYW